MTAGKVIDTQAIEQGDHKGRQVAGRKHYYAFFAS